MTKSGVKQRIESREPEILYEGGFDRWTRRRASFALIAPKNHRFE